MCLPFRAQVGRVLSIGVLLATASWARAEPIRLVVKTPLSSAGGSVLIEALQARLPGAEVVAMGDTPRPADWRVEVAPLTDAPGYEVRLTNPAAVSVSRRIEMPGRVMNGVAERAVAVYVCELLEMHWPAIARQSSRMVTPGRDRLPPVSDTVRPPAMPVRRSRLGIETTIPRGTVPSAVRRPFISIGAAASVIGSLDAGPVERATAGGAALRLLGGQQSGWVGVLRLAWGHSVDDTQGDVVDLIPISAGAGWRWQLWDLLALYTDLHVTIVPWTAVGDRRESGAEYGGGLGLSLEVHPTPGWAIFVDTVFDGLCENLEFLHDGRRVLDVGHWRWRMAFGVALDVL